MNNIQNLWIILFLPIVSALLILGLNNFISRLKKPLILFLSLFTSIVSFLISFICAKYLIENPNQTIYSDILFLNAGNLKIHLGVFLDNISAFFINILYITAFCAEIFAFKYLKNKEGFARFYFLLKLLIFSSAGMFLSTNLIQSCLFLGLTGVIACTFIAFDYKNPEIKIPFFRALTLNGIGDLAMIIAVLALIYFALQNPNEATYPLLSLVEAGSWGFLAYIQLGTVIYTGLCLLLIINSIIKAAQFPFQTWLLDAARSPFPALALICGATCTGSAIFLLIRIYPILILSPVTLNFIGILGGLTALLCGIIAFLQNDIKKILTFGSASNLGIIFTALGSGAYSGAIFQLGMYILAIAMLFLISGIITNKTFTSNVKFLGGLREFMPTLAAGWILGALSLSGMLFSGFYSKEMIFGHLYDSNQFQILILLSAAFLITVLYMSRGYFLIFEGKYRGSYDFLENQSPENARFVTIPVYLLGILTAFLGGFLAPDFQKYIYIIRQKFYLIKHPETEILLFIISILTIYIAWIFFGARKLKLNKIRFYRIILNPILSFLRKTLILQLYINKIYEILFIIFFKIPAKIANFIDKYIIEGLTVLLSQFVRFVSYLSLRAQNGNINFYIFACFGFISITLLCVAIIFVKEFSHYGI